MVLLRPPPAARTEPSPASSTTVRFPGRCGRGTFALWWGSARGSRVVSEPVVTVEHRGFPCYVESCLSLCLPCLLCPPRLCGGHRRVRIRYGSRRWYLIGDRHRSGSCVALSASYGRGIGLSGRLLYGRTASLRTHVRLPRTHAVRPVLTRRPIRGLTARPRSPRSSVKRSPAPATKIGRSGSHGASPDVSPERRTRTDVASTVACCKSGCRFIKTLSATATCSTLYATRELDDGSGTNAAEARGRNRTGVRHRSRVSGCGLNGPHPD